MKKISLSLIASIILAACSTRQAPAEFELPYRLPLEKVPFSRIAKDGICPGDQHIYLSEDALRALLRNVENTETYILQLENLLKSLKSLQ